MARKRKSSPSAVVRTPAPALPAASMAGAHDAAGDDQALASWNPFAGSADADLLTDLPTLMARSRDLARNNGLMSGGMQTLRDNIVGATLRLSAMPDYRLLGISREQAREWANTTEALHRSWADSTECDAARSLNLLGLTLQALGSAMLNGDAVALPLWLPRAGQRWNTRLMLVESDRLATPLELRHRDNIRGGIEFDTWGAPVAYYILKHHPGDAISIRAASQEYERIPAYTPWGRKRVLHLHDKERTGQSRGKPIVSGVMRELRMAGQYATNELKASVANSLIAAFIESDLDQESTARLFGDDPSAVWKSNLLEARKAGTFSQMRGTAVIPLPPGARVNNVAPGRPNPAFEAFMLASLRNIAAGMNLPYELLLKDFSKSNYSSARAALLEAWRYFNGRRRWLTDYWLRDIYDLWLEEAVNAGLIHAPNFYQQRYAYARARFLFGGRGWVDPVKDAQAAEIRLRAGLTTRERECAEQGEDWEEVMDQQQIEQQMLAERGLNFTGATQATPAAGQAGAGETADADNPDDKEPA